MLLFLLCWLVLPPKLSFQSPLKVKTMNYYTRWPFGRAIEISSTVISHGRTLFLCKRNLRGIVPRKLIIKVKIQFNSMIYF